jgi:hypothetical protein
VCSDSRIASTNPAIRSGIERVEDFQYARAAASTPSGITPNAKTSGKEPTDPMSIQIGITTGNLADK